MYFLKNEQITVEVLDPAADVARLGSRYCTGGYIWQVSDVHKGPLLTGPEWPKEPNTFDGQGMPDMFFRALGAENAPVGGEVGCIGVGKVRRTSPVEPFYVFHNREVIEFVHWEVDDRSGKETPAVHMRTQHTFRDWSYELERSVTLHGRTVDSHTAIRSLGEAVLPVVWFAHPFFPIPANNVLCRFLTSVSMPDNPGFFLDDAGFVNRKAEHDWGRGWYQSLDYAKEDAGLKVLQKHDLVGQVTAATDFMPSFLPIWGNDKTFSFEPYFTRDFAQGESAAWSIAYTF
ncbi:MAG: hypothetical protein IH586_05785 [Anaerolineaceae bacterium]|nr:hypothetical protein [Anaerolineaceae bacterium]